jgi:hypothetical protein
MRKRTTITAMLVLVASLPDIRGHVAAQVATPAIPTETVAEVGPCKFKIANMFGGKLIVPDRNRENNQQGIYDLPDAGPNASPVIRTFALFCVAASDEKIGTMLNAKKINGKWMQYNPWPNQNIPELMPFDAGARPRTVQLKGSNWTGTGLTVDETTGDEDRRTRRFNFCLIHTSHALCGDSPVQRLADPRKRNELWKMKAILESVEFVDAPAQSTPEIDSVPRSVQ